jgi:hypothetical protein
MFFGYEARAGLPSDFDTAYCYALGFNAGALLQHGCTGLISSVTNLGAPVEQWKCGGVPLTVMMNLERRHGKDKPVIRKALVELSGLPFKTFAAARARWALNDCYRVPGPVQLDLTGKQRQADGSHRVDPLCFTLALELQEREAHGSHAAASGAPKKLGDLASYAALCEGIIGTEGPDGVDAHDVHKLDLYRLAHGISDADHIATLGGLGLSQGDWAAVVARTRRQAAGHA